MGSQGIAEVEASGLPGYELAYLRMARDLTNRP